jgi:hypothetical protein
VVMVERKRPGIHGSPGFSGWFNGFQCIKMIMTFK